MLKMGWFGVVRGHPRSLKIAPFDRAHMSSYQLSIVTVPYLAPFLRYREILAAKRRQEPTPPLFGALVGVISWEFRQDFWHRKTRVFGLSYCVVSLILGLAIFVQLRLVTDGRTDGQTDRHTMTANTALAQRRAVKKLSKNLKKRLVHKPLKVLQAEIYSVSMKAVGTLVFGMYYLLCLQQ